MEKIERLALGVVLERRDLDNPWQDHEWRPVAVLAGGPPAEEWRLLAEGPGWRRYYTGTLTLELHHKETEGYILNLSGKSPSIFVVLRRNSAGAGGQEVRPFLVTASPHEASAYLDGGESLVEEVPLPAGLAAWIEAFVAEHHVERPFVKRRRDDVRPGRERHG